jgi:hypothetical protein
MSKVSERTYRLSTRAGLIFWVLALLGGGTLATGLILEPQRQRTWIDLFLISNYLIGLALGGLLLVGLHYLTGARWSLPIKRAEEAMTAVLPVASIGLILVLVCRPSLYSWSSSASPEVFEPPLQRLWLSRPFFLVRSVIYLALWLIFAASIVRNSRRQDRSEDPTPFVKNIRLSALFLVVFGFTFWLASNDWIMSLEPQWSSTIFGVYNFAGLFLSAIAVLVLLIIWLWRFGPLQSVVNENHLHDLGTLLFAFSSFWMYIWFCQYMLIWYTDNPEETTYLLARRRGLWPVFLLVDLVLNWGIPFVVLLFRSAKRSPLVLGTVACGVLLGRWVDLSLMILPSQGDWLSTPSLLEVGFILGMIGLFVLVFFWSLSKAPLIPLNESIPLEEGRALS